MRAVVVRISTWIGCATCLCACAVVRPQAGEPAPLANSLQELIPHLDRDHFVFVWERIANGRRLAAGIQVEHVSTAGNGNFEVTLSEDGRLTGRLHIRDDGHALLLLAEDDVERGVRLAYDPPLPQLVVPLFPGERRAEANVTVSQLADDQTLGTMHATQVTQAEAAPPVRTALGTYERAVVLRNLRSLQGDSGTNQLQISMVLVPGIGEVRSDGAASGEPVLRRELACAIIGGRRIGDCQNLNQRLEELRHAGSTDLR